MIISGNASRSSAPCCLEAEQPDVCGMFANMPEAADPAWKLRDAARQDLPKPYIDSRHLRPFEANEAGTSTSPSARDYTSCTHRSPQHQAQPRCTAPSALHNSARHIVEPSKPYLAAASSRIRPAARARHRQTGQTSSFRRGASGQHR